MTEPISLAEAKAQLRVDHSDQDALINALIETAREEVESSTWRSLVSGERLLSARGFPTLTGWRLQANDVRIYLPFPPLRSVTEIAYLDENGVSQILDPSKYVVDTSRQPGTIEPAYGETWPQTRDHPQAVTITVEAGYATPADVPASAKHAIKLLVAELYEQACPAPLSPAGGGVGTVRTTLDLLLEKLLVRHAGILDWS